MYAIFFGLSVRGLSLGPKPGKKWVRLVPSYAPRQLPFQNGGDTDISIGSSSLRRSDTQILTR